VPTISAVIQIEVPDLADAGAVDDATLIEWTRLWGEARRVVDSGIAVLAGHIATRSALELGIDGLAYRAGARTADRLVSQITGASGPEARTMISVGSMLDEPAPWLAEVARGVEAGEISVGAAAAIQNGLGSPTGDVAADDLADAARALAVEARNATPERVAQRARELRDSLDEDGVADREEAVRQKRYLRLSRLADGMTRITGLLDPESAAVVTDAFDSVTAPRRGGPRFVDPAGEARADAIIEDQRTTEQLTLDAFVEMIRIAGAADNGRVFGTRKPAVRLIATVADLDRRAGAGLIEGHSAAVSIATVERHICSGGYLPILFDDTDALDLGRAQRLHSEKQRAVLAAIWGGCAIPGCDRPPSWTEAHHPEEWGRDHGQTSVRNGILLCRHHHMMVHNRGWHIRRKETDYWLEAPPGDRLNPNPIRLVRKGLARLGVQAA
jgi:hypothetical protein